MTEAGPPAGLPHQAGWRFPSPGVSQRGVENGVSLDTPAGGSGSLPRPGAAFPLRSGAGGDFAEWVRRVHEDEGDPLGEAEEPMRWLFAIHTFGPLLTDNKLSHDEKCDVIAALEKSLADSMAKAGYEVLNRVHCQMPLNNELWEQAREQFARAFPKLTTLWRDALGRES